MAVHLTPYLSFPGTAREAMQHYHRILGGELSLMTFGEFGESSPELADKIMHGALETPSGIRLMGADSPPGMEFRPGNTVTVLLHGDDDATLRAYWDGLSAGGTIDVPLELQMWGDVWGQCTDRFGTSWQVDIGTEDGGAAQAGGPGEGGEG